MSTDKVGIGKINVGFGLVVLQDSAIQICCQDLVRPHRK